MSQQAVFSIRNLTCAYVENKPVLYVDKLDLPRGKLIFVIGKSGIGKSTFIETLGLMNNTIVSRPETDLLFYPQPDADSVIELKNSWSLPNEKRSSFRRHHFSFVFQETNLMPNFTAGENMMISLLINGVPKVEAEQAVREVMIKLSLPEDIFNKRITELSGGQRQRLAFVRAITRNFTVLYGDEPTGNLDEKTAGDLMKTFKDIIISEQKTGVIVSHDLALAYKFADMIIPIITEKNDNGQTVGKITAKQVVEIEGDILKDHSGQHIEKPLAYLSQFLSDKVFDL